MIHLLNYFKKNYKKSILWHQVYRYEPQYYIMNKAAGIGIAVIIIVVIVGIAYSLSSTESSEENLPTVDDLNLDESILLDEEVVSEEPEQEIVSEEPEQEGTEFSVELTETVGIKSSP